jgi:hypothetical protein
MADLDVVLKKEHPLVLIMSSHSHHCRNPQQTHNTFVSVDPMAAVQSNALLQRERTQEGKLADLEVVLKKEHLMRLTLSSHSHHCMNRPE